MVGACDLQATAGGEILVAKMVGACDLQAAAGDGRFRANRAVVAFVGVSTRT